MREFSLKSVFYFCGTWMVTSKYILHPQEQVFIMQFSGFERIFDHIAEFGFTRMTYANVVLPVSGSPQRMMEEKR